LLKRRQPLNFVERNIFDWSEEASWRCCDVNHWIDCVFEVTFLQKGHLSLLWNALAFNFQMFESNYHLLGQFLLNVASMSAVNHHWVAVLVSQVRKIVK